jgi:quercetin dioxygenase-like cupin family protein
MEPRFAELAEIATFAMAPGATGQALFGEKGMLNVVEMEPGAEIPHHSHPHEQLGAILRGSMTMIVGGVRHEVATHDLYVIPGDVEHGGTAGPDGVLVLDVFVPVREDYRQAAGG